MAYFNTTIKDLITERIGRNTFLPAIQREYVWNPAQVEKLFDSIMCGFRWATENNINKYSPTWYISFFL